MDSSPPKKRVRCTEVVVSGDSNVQEMRFMLFLLDITSTQAKKEVITKFSCVHRFPVSIEMGLSQAEGSQKLRYKEYFNVTLDSRPGILAVLSRFVIIITLCNTCRNL